MTQDPPIGAGEATLQRRSISMLIPVFNADCSALLTDLLSQAVKLKGVEWELCVAEDGSSDTDSIAANEAQLQGAHCRHLVYSQNVGRARIRNQLAREARGEWLLFIDSHMRVGKSDFLRTYLSAPDAEVVDGDYVVAADASEWSCSLRYCYEKACEHRHDAAARSKQPYAGFHTANFLVRRDFFLQNPLEESFSEYGYEDVLFGARMEQQEANILHIDNPVEFRFFESNSRFMDKTDAALHSLALHQDLLGRHSRLLTLYSHMRKWHLHKLGAALFRWRGKRWRQRLCQEDSRPSLRLFNTYRIFCFCAETEKMKNER